ncbi:hypothetical protein FGB62_27g11 [Gracilaria domingensis]|nr:hypothetical protein FGB62_27g11 [Gracilaria domingensis]
MNLIESNESSTHSGSASNDPEEDIQVDIAQNRGNNLFLQVLHEIRIYLREAMEKAFNCLQARLSDLVQQNRGRPFRLERNKSDIDATDAKLLHELSLEMKVNSSVIDNEFFECDIPFDVNFSRLRSPKKWFSSTEPWFTPRYTRDARMRYMVPLLAQYGRKWLQDSVKVKRIVKRDHFYICAGFSMGHFVRYAKMLLSGSPCESIEESRACNWSKTWSSVLMWRKYMPFEFNGNIGMPFGSKPHKNFISVPTFPRFHSKTKRLVDSLPDELFETETNEKLEIIQQICGKDLDNFMVFLNSDVVNPAKEPSVASGSQRSLSSKAALVSNGSQRGDVDDDISESKGMKEAHGGSGRRAQSSEDVIEEDTAETTEISNQVERDLQSLEYVTACDGHIDIWSLGRVVNEKFSEFDARIGTFLCSGSVFSPYHKSYSETRVVQFTIHLENLFATYSGSMLRTGRETTDNHDRNRYYEDVCGKPTGRRPLFAKENQIPVCASESYYWDLWDLPRCTPPALGDSDVQELFKGTGIENGGIKIIGYIMGIVRDGLAKWTNENIQQNLGKEEWSPKVVVRSTQVEFDASDELRENFTQYMDSELSRPEIRNTTQCVRVLWECQKHLVQAINDNVYGPSDIHLMLLCILGFPALLFDVERLPDLNECFFDEQHPDLKTFEETGSAISTASTNSTNDSKIKMLYKFMPRGSGERLSTAVSFRVCENTLKIRMQLIPVYESGLIQLQQHSVTFKWVEWIHGFEACMKVLTYDYGDRELCEIRTDEDSSSQSESEALVFSNTAIGNNYDTEEDHDPKEAESRSNAKIEASGAEEGSKESESNVVQDSDAIIAETEEGMEGADDERNESTAAEWDDTAGGHGAQSVQTDPEGQARVHQGDAEVLLGMEWMEGAEGVRGGQVSHPVRRQRKRKRKRQRRHKWRRRGAAQDEQPRRNANSDAAVRWRDWCEHKGALGSTAASWVNAVVRRVAVPRRRRRHSGPLEQLIMELPRARASVGHSLYRSTSDLIVMNLNLGFVNTFQNFQIATLMHPVHVPIVAVHVAEDMRRTSGGEGFEFDLHNLLCIVYHASVCTLVPVYALRPRETRAPLNCRNTAAHGADDLQGAMPRTCHELPRCAFGTHPTARHEQREQARMAIQSMGDGAASSTYEPSKAPPTSGKTYLSFETLLRCGGDTAARLRVRAAVAHLRRRCAAPRRKAGQRRVNGSWSASIQHVPSATNVRFRISGTAQGVFLRVCDGRLRSEVLT